MKFACGHFISSALCWTLFTSPFFVSGQNLSMPTATLSLAPSTNLQIIVDASVRATLERLTASRLKPDQFAVTLVDLNSPEHPLWAGYRGKEKIYPASVIKLFY